MLTMDSISNEETPLVNGNQSVTRDEPGQVENAILCRVRSSASCGTHDPLETGSSNASVHATLQWTPS